MAHIEILPETIKDPLSFMGRMAGIAYDSDISNQEKNYRRGRQCVLDNHGRLLEFIDVYMHVSEISARAAREIFRHTSDGLSAVQRSTRYCKESSFGYYRPPTVDPQYAIKTDAVNDYESAMDTAQSYYNNLLEDGISAEDAANVLPLGIEAPFVMKKNARALATMSNVRLCNRAYVETREFMQDLVRELRSYSDEWRDLSYLIFMPKCQKTGWCDEHKSCGLYPKKDDVKVVRKGYLEKLEKFYSDNINKVGSSQN